MATKTSPTRLLSEAVKQFKDEMGRHGLGYEELRRGKTAAVIELEGKYRVIIVSVGNISTNNSGWYCGVFEDLVAEYDPKLAIIYAGEANFPGPESNKNYANKYKPDYRRIGYVETILKARRIRKGLYEEVFTPYDYDQLRRGLEGLKFTRVV